MKCEHLDYDEYFEKCHDCGKTLQAIHDEEPPLAPRCYYGRAVYIRWSTEDVADVRTDLSQSECLAVLLMACHNQHDASVGVNWDTLECWADEVSSWPQERVDRIVSYGQEHGIIT